MDTGKKRPGVKRVLARIAIILLLLLLILIGVTVLFYPNLSEYINEKNSARILEDYRESVAGLSQTDYSGYLSEAREYNERLYRRGGVLRDAFASERETYEQAEYMQLLNVDGNGVMGNLSIEKIDVQLPVYHGTGDVALAVGVGHVEGSSLPVGGENTHVVLSAHTGLPSAKLFTNLDRLEPGDRFTLTILGERLVYEVDTVSVVLPDETAALAIEPSCDYVTLVTCTPYGINSHRLLVRGARAEDVQETHDEGDELMENEGQSGRQSFLSSLFAWFAGIFEAVARFLVGAAEWGMRLFAAEY